MIEYKIEKINIDMQTIVHTKDAMNWCKRPYPGYPDGCPNYGKPLCPPNSPYIGNFIKDYNYFNIFYLIFNLDLYEQKRVIIHPDWSKEQLRNSRHWQNSLKSKLKNNMLKIININYNNDLFILGCGSGFYTKDIRNFQGKIYSMEAVGINVYSTLRLNKIYPERNPIHKVILCGMIMSNDQLKENKRMF